MCLSLSVCSCPGQDCVILAWTLPATEAEDFEACSFVRYFFGCLVTVPLPFGSWWLCALLMFPRLPLGLWLMGVPFLGVAVSGRIWLQTGTPARKTLLFGALLCVSLWCPLLGLSSVPWPGISLAVRFGPSLVCLGLFLLVLMVHPLLPPLGPLVQVSSSSSLFYEGSAWWVMPD